MNSSSHSVNGDIAIQWEWSNFDPSQNPNPLTDYDKTLHKTRQDEHVTQNLCQWTLMEHLGKYVKYKALSFFILIYFFPDSPTEAIRGRIFTHSGSNYAQSRKEVPFWVCTMTENIYGVKFPKNRQNWALICSAERLSCASMKIARTSLKFK